MIRRVVTWDDVLRAADYLATQIEPRLPEIDSLYTISRGGLPLVSCLTHRLSLVVPIRVIQLSSYFNAFERNDNAELVPPFSYESDKFLTKVIRHLWSWMIYVIPVVHSNW